MQLGCQATQYPNYEEEGSIPGAPIVAQRIEAFFPSWARIYQNFIENLPKTYPYIRLNAFLLPIGRQGTQYRARRAKMGKSGVVLSGSYQVLWNNPDHVDIWRWSHLSFYYSFWSHPARAPQHWSGLIICKGRAVLVWASLNHSFKSNEEWIWKCYLF